MSDDPHNLQRFVDVQRSTYDQALAELLAGRKQSHWMWFIFPQLAGLGHSAMAQRYGIKSIDEAAAYLQHPLLGPRLEECAAALLQHKGRSAQQILGSPDDMKLRSSMTLFSAAAPETIVYRQIIDHFYDGHVDPATLARL
ncbi:DUF1810 domain-containing protein [Stutzerimonas stutzeri]|uniref:DUF1810 domain-containing protein n=1 Tax=Stutzerimonas stutzeri TaxID=316 RepID=UPI00210A3B41|nr:DUF1810 domain-containing protein [Stutzerimonas stutzeri]MCQ4260330.1 DUF1810 domain-containing protein [Stutzerimonas stutzeri]